MFLQKIIYKNTICPLVLLLTFWGLFSQQCFAQQVKYSLEAGFSVGNVTLISQEAGYKVRGKAKEIYRPHFGVRIELSEGKRSSFETGLFYLKTGSILEERNNFKEYMNFSYIKVPLEFKHKIILGKGNESFYFTLGGYLSYLNKAVLTFNGLEFNIHEGRYKLLKRMDFGAVVGIGYQTPSGFYFRGNISRGFNNLNINEFKGNLGDYKILNTPVFGLTFGFQFQHL